MKKTLILLMLVNCFTGYLLAQDKEWNTIIEDIPVYALEYDRPFIWAITDDHLYKIDQNDNSVYSIELPGNPFFPFLIVADREGNPWVYSRDAGLYHWDGDEWLKNEFNIRDYWVTDVIFDLDNYLWISTTSGIYKYDGENWSHFNSSNSDMPYNMVSCMEVDQYNNLWIGNTDELSASSHKLVRFDGENWIEFPMEIWMNIHEIYPDNSGSVLALCEDINEHFTIMKLTGNQWVSVLDIPNEYKITNFAIENEKAFWFSSTKGVFRYEKKEWKVFDSTKATEIKHNQINGIVIDDNGKKWIATNAGLLSLSNQYISL